MVIDPKARYTKTHEWIRQDGSEYVYGITDHAQSELSDIVFVDLPGAGDSFDAGDTVGVVESVKAASDLYMPVAGEVLAVNEGLVDAPEAINQDAYGAGWLIRFKIADPAEYAKLLSADEYAALIGE